MKKVEKERDSARKSAAREREKGKSLALVTALAPIGTALAAPMLLPLVPGPTPKEFENRVKAKKGAATSKRVLILGGVTLGLVMFGGSSWEARAASAVAGAITGDAILAYTQAAAVARGDLPAAASLVMSLPEGKS